MRVLVIGGGLMGLTSAYFLSREGCEVTLVEREAGAGRGASFANGAMLTPSMPQPWNSPGVASMLMRSFFASDTALKVRPLALPKLIGWGLKFLRNSAPECVARATYANLRLAHQSLQLMHLVRADTAIEYGRTTQGTLRIFRNPKMLDAATNAAECLRLEGLHFHRLTRDQLVATEPALAPIGAQLSGGLHYPCDETGDALRFSESLADVLVRRGVSLNFNTSASSLQLKRDRVVGVKSSAGLLTADQYLIAAGSYSAPLLKAVGVDLPVRPAKGYSITLNERPVLSMPVIDDDLHAAVIPLGDGLRVAGTAEFSGFDRTLDPARIDNLFRLLEQVIPQQKFERDTAKAWCGLRPMSADGVPIIGRTPFSNVFVNSGHGPLGWTMAAASGRLLSDILCGVPPQIDPLPYALSRFRRGD